MDQPRPDQGPIRERKIAAADRGGPGQFGNVSYASWRDRTSSGVFLTSRSASTAARAADIVMK